MFCGLVFVFAEAADELPPGVHYFELGAEGVFDVDGFLAVFECEGIFAELFGDFGHLQVESGKAWVAVDGGGDAIECFVEGVCFFPAGGDIGEEGVDFGESLEVFEVGGVACDCDKQTVLGALQVEIGF